ncbi:MAG: ABC transporter substrate-binding protein [Chloroflexota bacterium]|nr:ABC transporter substrate-binding protein [Chloroflexota bacterium]
MTISRRRLLLAGSAAAFSVACSGTPAGRASAAASATAQPRAAASAGASGRVPLRIGVVVPYTEQAVDVDIGSSQRRAADLYLKQRGGALAGRRVELVYSDESTDPATDRVKVRDVLLGQEKVGLLMGGSATATAYVMRDVADAQHLVYLDTWAPANALTRANGGCTPSCKSTYVFRTSASSWQLGQPLGAWVARSGRAQVVAVYADDAFGAETTAAFAEGLARYGGALTRKTAVPRGSDQATVVAQLKTQGTKAVFAAFRTDDAEAFLTEWGKAGMRASGYALYGPGTLADTEVLHAAKDAAAGVVTSHFWSPDLSNGENKKLISDFRAEYKDDETGEPLAPDGYAVAMWDAMAALEAALTATSGATSDPAALVAALERVSFAGPRGRFAFDPATHDVVTDVRIREARLSGGAVANVVVDTVPKVADPGR